MKGSQRRLPVFVFASLCWLIMPACQPAGEQDADADQPSANTPVQNDAAEFPDQPLELVLPVVATGETTELVIAYLDGLVPAVGDDAILELQANNEWVPAGRARVVEVAAETLRLNPYEGGLAAPGRVRIQIPRPLHRCDLLAASPLDAYAVAPPVPFERLSVEAVEYCGQAVSQYPATVRFRFQLARALDAHQQQAAAIMRYRECLMFEPDYSAALLALAGKYQTGAGLPVDLAAAEQMLQQAHALGNPRASYLLAQLWLTASPQDGATNARALELERSAATAGDRQAQARLASRYETGEGVPQDREQSLSWHEKAAAQGLTDSQMALAKAFAQGSGRPQDWARAREWWQQAANHDHVPAQLALADSLEQGQGLPGPDYQQAMYWYRRVAEGGDAWGQYHLGRMFAQGRGTQASPEEAEKWLRMALAGGVDEARRWLRRAVPRQHASEGQEDRLLAERGRRLNEMRLFRVKTQGYMDSHCRSVLRQEMHDLGLREVNASKSSARLVIHMSKPVYYQSSFGPFTTTGYRLQYQAEVLRRGDDVRLFYTRGSEDGDDRTEACTDALDEIFDDLDDARD